MKKNLVGMVLLLISLSILGILVGSLYGYLPKLHYVVTVFLAVAAMMFDLLAFMVVAGIIPTPWDETDNGE